MSLLCRTFIPSHGRNPSSEFLLVLGNKWSEKPFYLFKMYVLVVRLALRSENLWSLVKSVSRASLD